MEPAHGVFGHVGWLGEVSSQDCRRLLTSGNSTWVPKPPKVKVEFRTDDNVTPFAITALNANGAALYPCANCEAREDWQIVRLTQLIGAEVLVNTTYSFKMGTLKCVKQAESSTSIVFMLERIGR